MSSTPYATDGQFHQERFCSAPEFGRGLLANLVAKRCETLPDASERELIWSLQFLSHRVGLEKVSGGLLSRFADRVGTASMQRLKLQPGQICNSEQVRLIRREMPAEYRDTFILQGEMTGSERLHRAACLSQPYSRQRLMEERLPEAAEGADEHPEGYAADKFLHICRAASDSLPGVLADLCVNPEKKLAECQPWYFASLIECLKQYMNEWIEARRASVAPTELSTQIYEALDFTLQSGALTILDGPPLRTGKSFAAKTWCDLHPGRARFVEPPSSSESSAFYRAVAEAVGSTSALSYKGSQLRERAEQAIRSSKLMLIFDDADFLGIQTKRRETPSTPLNWILNGLVKHDVPVTLLTSPEFAKGQQIMERRTGWTSAQFFGRTADYKKLPQVLSLEELEAIARLCLPAGDNKSIQALSLYAVGSGRYITAIESVAKRAKFIAGKAGRAQPTFADISEAINHYVIPSDLALTKALERVPAGGALDIGRKTKAGEAGSNAKPSAVPGRPIDNPRSTMPGGCRVQIKASQVQETTAGRAAQALDVCSIE